MYKKIIYISIIIICILLDIYFIHSYLSLPKAINVYTSNKVEIFNHQFDSYKGKNTGKDILSLCGRLVANSFTYSEELEKVPTVIYKNEISINCNDNNLEKYRSELTNLKENIIDENTTYTVSFSYDKSGLIKSITIK